MPTLSREVAPAASLKSRSPRIARLLRPLAVVAALGAAGNVILAWVAAGAGALDLGALLAQPLFYVAVLLALVPWGTNTLRLALWSRFLGRPLSWRHALRIVFATDIGSAVTPTAAGGGYVKLGLLVERGFSPGAAASLMILGSVEDYLFFALAVPATLAASGAWRLPAMRAVGAWLGGNSAVPALIVAAVIALATVFRRPLARRLGRFWRDFAQVYRLIAQRGKRRFAATLAIAAVQWTCRYAATAVLLACLGAPIDLAVVFLLQWAVFAAALVVPTPGGMVGAEAAFYFAYGAFIPDRLLPGAVAAWRLLTFYGPLALGALGFTVLQRGWRPLVESGTSPALGT